MTLLDECIEALGNSAEIVCDSDKKKILEYFKRSYPFTKWGRIDWESAPHRVSVTTLSDILSFLTKRGFDLSTPVYIIWDEVTLPVVKSNLPSVIEVIDDVSAVSFDTWIYSDMFKYVVEFYHEGEITIGLRSN